MRNGFLGSLAVLLLCNLAAWAQTGPVMQPFQPPSPPTPGYYPRGEEVDADSEFVRDNRCVPEGHVPEPESVSWWFGGEVLKWRVKDGNLPVTLAAYTLTPQVGNASPFTTAIGSSPVDYGRLTGGRATFGIWLDDKQSMAFETRGFVLESGGAGFLANSGTNGQPPLSIPFFNPVTVVSPLAGPLTVGPQAQLIAIPGFPAAQAFGYVQVNMSNRLWGLECNFTDIGWDGFGFHVGVISGFRYVDFGESLNILYRQTAGTGPIFFNGTALGQGNAVSAVDTFTTRNQFFGGQLGIRIQYDYGIFYAGVDGKVGLGVTHQSLGIAGVSYLFPGNLPPFTLPGGFWAVSSNSGHFTANRFGVVPEIEPRVGIHWRWLNAFVGYDLMGLNQVLRAGDQLDSRIDPRQVPTSPWFSPGTNIQLPLAPNKHTNFTAQGLIVGVEFLF